jgi:hypothetical protein
MVPSFLFAVQYGTLGLALTWVLVFPLVMLFNIVSVLRLIRGSFRAYLRAILPPLFMSSIMLAGLLGFSSSTPVIVNVWVTIAIMVFGGAFVYLGGMFILSKQRLLELYQMRK